MQLPDETTLQHALSIMKGPPKVLADDEFDIVANSFAALLHPEIDGGVVAHACAIESTHVHLLVGAVQEDILGVVDDLAAGT